MYLGYLDDSGSHKKSDVVVVAAALIPHDQFQEIEAISGALIERLIPEDWWEDFQRFHASEMWAADNSFEGIDRDKCRDAMRIFAEQSNRCAVEFIYSALSKKKLAESPAGSASSLDVAFRMCLQSIQLWLRGQGAEGDFAMLICDNGDKKVTTQFEESFRTYRKKLKPPDYGLSLIHDGLPLIHDEMYFGSSKYSVGLQVADLCAWLVNRRLSGHDDADAVRNKLVPRLHCAKWEPFWTQGKHYLLELPK